MLRLKIQRDSDTGNPRKDDDNFGTMVTWHRRYTLGDTHPREDPVEWLAEVPKGSVTLALYLYDHSGLSMRCEAFGDVWDSGQVGFITASPAQIRKEYGVKRISQKLRDRVTEVLRGEVQVYDWYLTGDTWGYVLEDTIGAADDSCWGFRGSTLAETGIAEHIPKYLHEVLEEAWDLRGSDNWVLHVGLLALETSHG